MGDLAWVGSGTSGIKPGWWLNDFNMDTPDIQPPYSNGLPLTQNPNYDGKTVTIKYILGSGDYFLNTDLSLSGGDILEVMVPLRRVDLNDSLTPSSR